MVEPLLTDYGIARAAVGDLLDWGSDLHERLLMEQISHYQATRDLKVAQRGIKTTEDYRKYLSATDRRPSERFLNFLGIEREDFCIEEIDDLFR